MDDQIEKRDTSDIVCMAFARASRKDATPEDGRELRELLRWHPEHLSLFSDVIHSQLRVVLDVVTRREASAATMWARFDELRENLGRDVASPRNSLLSIRWR